MISRDTARRIWDFAGSRNLAVFVLLMSITYVLVLFVFGLLVEVRWLHVIAGLLPYKVLYALFFLNLTIWQIRWIPAVLRRCRSETMADVAHRLQAGRDRIEVHDGRALASYLAQRGYAVRGAERMTYAFKGRWSPVGNLLFHASFLLLLFGVLAGLLYGFQGSAVITEGHSFKGGRAEYRSIAGGTAASLPEVDFDLQKISASLWDGRMFFTRLEAELMHRRGSDVARVSSAASVGGADVTLSGYGYAPMYVLVDAAGEVQAQGYVNLNIFARGSEDDFRVPGYPHRIFVSFHPDYTSKSMDPVNPAYSLRIFRGRLPVYTGVVRPGEWADYDGMRISFPTFARFGEFRIVRDPGQPLVWAAFFMMSLGLAWRALFYRRELLLWRDSEGRTWLTGRFDSYPGLHARWLEALAGKFSGRAA